MLISAAVMKRYFGVRPTGVLHAGAHEAEEASTYSALDWGPVIWVEMLPEKFEQLKVRFAQDKNNIVLHAACWDADGIELPLFRASNGQSSSLLTPRDHVTAYSSISFVENGTIKTSRLDSILPASPRFDFINLDIQGAELRALRGLGDRLSGVKWAYVEVNTKPLYDGCALIANIDAFMEDAGFVRLLTKMAKSKTWGDALYVDTKHLRRSELAWLKTKARIWAALDAIRRIVRRPRLIAEYIRQ
jgi:FkbM family methyltransferase